MGVIRGGSRPALARGTRLTIVRALVVSILVSSMKLTGINGGATGSRRDHGYICMEWRYDLWASDATIRALSRSSELKLAASRRVASFDKVAWHNSTTVCLNSIYLI